MAVARRADPDYELPITREWIEEVRAALSKERGLQARVARQVGCAPSTLNEMLNDLLPGERRSSHLVPAISKTLGISTTAMIVSADTHEIVAFLEKMGPDARHKMRELKSLDKSQLDLVLGMIAQMSKTKED